jgi:hypothetical protein
MTKKGPGYYIMNRHYETNHGIDGKNAGEQDALKGRKWERRAANAKVARDLKKNAW